MGIKIVIVPACTDLNRGDQSLVWEAAYIAKDAFGSETDISIVDYGMNQRDRLRQSAQTRKAGFRVIRNIIENPKRINSASKEGVHSKWGEFFLAATLAVFDFIRHLMILIVPSKRVFNVLFSTKEHKDSFRTFLEADLYVVKGGGFLHTYGKLEDLYYLWFGLYHVLLAKRLGKKVVVLPNSVGPITGKLNRAFVKMVLDKVDILYVREKISLDHLCSIGVAGGRFSYDLGYYSRPESVMSFNENLFEANGKKRVGITVRPYRFPKSSNPEEQYSNYVQVIASICNRFSEYEYYFIIQVQGPSAHETDMIAVKDVVKSLAKNISYKIIDYDYNYKQMLSIYKEMDYLVGTRFHSVIFSQVMNVPSLAIAYGGNKTRGIMREIGLERYVIDIENINTKELNDAFLSLIENSDEYMEDLLKAKSVIEKERECMVNTLKLLFKVES